MSKVFIVLIKKLTLLLLLSYVLADDESNTSDDTALNDPISNLKSKLSTFTTSQLDEGRKQEPRKLYGSNGNFESLESSPYISTYEELSKIKALQNKLSTWTNHHDTDAKKKPENRRSYFPKNIRDKIEITSYTNFQQCPFVQEAQERMVDCKFAGRSNCWNVGSFDLSCPSTGLCCFDGCFNRCLEEPKNNPSIERRISIDKYKAKRRKYNNKPFANGGPCPSYQKPSTCENHEPSNCRAVGKHDLDCPNRELCCFNGCSKRCFNKNEQFEVEEMPHFDNSTAKKSSFSKEVIRHEKKSNQEDNKFKHPWIHTTKPNKNSSARRYSSGSGEYHEPYSSLHKKDKYRQNNSNFDDKRGKRKSKRGKNKKKTPNPRKNKKIYKSKPIPEQQQYFHNSENSGEHNGTFHHFKEEDDVTHHEIHFDGTKHIGPYETSEEDFTNHDIKQDGNEYDSYPYFDYGDFHADDVQSDEEKQYQGDIKHQNHGNTKKNKFLISQTDIIPDIPEEPNHNNHNLNDAADIDHYVDMTNEYVGAILSYALKDEEIITTFNDKSSFDEDYGSSYPQEPNFYHHSSSRFDSEPNPIYHTIGVRRQQTNGYNSKQPVVIMHIYGQSDGMHQPSYDQYNRYDQNSYDHQYRDYRDVPSYHDDNPWKGFTTKNPWKKFTTKKSRYVDIKIPKRRKQSIGKRNTLHLEEQ